MSELSGMNAPYSFAYSDDGQALITVEGLVDNDRDLRRRMPKSSVGHDKFLMSNSLNCSICGTELVSSGGPSTKKRAAFLDGMLLINSSGEYIIKIVSA